MEKGHEACSIWSGEVLYELRADFSCAWRVRTKRGCGSGARLISPSLCVCVFARGMEGNSLGCGGYEMAPSAPAVIVDVIRCKIGRSCELDDGQRYHGLLVGIGAVCVVAVRRHCCGRGVLVDVWRDGGHGRHTDGVDVELIGYIGCG